MGVEVLLIDELGSGKASFINLLLGVTVLPEASNATMLPAVRIMADQPTGLWFRPLDQNNAVVPIDAWEEIPDEWTVYEHAEMMMDGHPLLNRGIIFWDVPSINASSQNHQDYVRKFLHKHEAESSAVLFFVPEMITRSAVEFLLHHPVLLERTTIVIVIKKLKTASQCAAIERAVREISKRILKNIPVELVYICDIYEEFQHRTDEKRGKLSASEVVRAWRDMQVDIDPLTAKHDQKDLRLRLFAIAGRMLDEGKIDFHTASDLVLRYYSDANNDQARFELAKRLMSRHEYTGAIKQYERLAEKNIPEALVTLAKCYEQGDGVTLSREYATQYWRRAADAGDIEAQYMYSHLLLEESGDAVSALAYLKHAALAGHVPANAEMGKAYMAGVGGEINNEKAIPFLTAAANAGDVEIMFLLGKCYHKGMGVVKDVRKAISLWETAAAASHLEALVALGDMFMLNIDRSRDPELAFQYYFKSAELGDAAGLFRVGSCYDRGEGVHQDAAKAIEYYTLSAEKNYALAQHNLGVSYSEGQGVAKDLGKAKYWLGLAAASGHESSIQALRELESGTGDEVKSGCFVVTAAFGRIDAPEVIFFRRYRDTHLLTHRLGRLLVAAYYRIGPILAVSIRRNDRLRGLARRGLRRLMSSLACPQQHVRNE